MLLQQRPPFQEPVAGQFVEGVGGPVAAYVGQEVVDEREGVGGVGGEGVRGLGEASVRLPGGL